MRVTREILVQLPQRTSDFVTTSGSIYLGRLAEWVGLTASEFSQATGQSVESVAKNFGKDPVGFRNGEARRVADELVEVVGLLQTLGMESDQAKRWLRTPNPAFDGRRPLTLIQEGDGRKLIDMLMSVALGGAGMGSGPKTGSDQ